MARPLDTLRPIKRSAAGSPINQSSDPRPAPANHFGFHQEMMAHTDRLMAQRTTHDKVFAEFIAFLAEAWILSNSSTEVNPDLAMRQRVKVYTADAGTASRYCKAARDLSRKKEKLFAQHPRHTGALQSGALDGVSESLRAILRQANAMNVSRAMQWCAADDCSPLPPTRTNRR